MTAAAAASRTLAAAARAFALVGGAALLAAAGTTLASVVGRTLFGSPILGDYELVERLVGVAVFLVLPYGHLVGGHVTVDLLVRRLPDGLRTPLAALVEVLFALTAAALAWRMAGGGADLWRYRETSMMLNLPTWWAFVAVVPALALLSLVCLLRARRALMPDDD